MPPRYDIPGLGLMTAAEFAEAYNTGKVPPDVMAPGEGSGEGLLVAHRDGRTVVWEESHPVTWAMIVNELASPRYHDPLFYIGAQ